MKTNHFALKLKNILFLMLLVIFILACKKEEPKSPPEYVTLDISYNAPNYPKKAAGRFLETVGYKYYGLDPEYLSSVFIYNHKNYLDQVNFYTYWGAIDSHVKIEYNLHGLVSKIKYFNGEDKISTVELFEYTQQNKLSKTSRYNRVDDLGHYIQESYNSFSYPSSDSIVELDFQKKYLSEEFDCLFKEIYLYNEAGNIKEVINYELDLKFPYASTDFFYIDKKKPFENFGFPTYELYFAGSGFQFIELLSKNRIIKSQRYIYENNAKVKLEDERSIEEVYDELGYPISTNSIYYHYTDLE